LVWNLTASSKFANQPFFMPKWITAIFVFFLSTTLLTAKAITVEDVISRHVQAMAAETAANAGHVDTETLSYHIKKGHAATLEGVESINGKACYKIGIDLQQGQKLYYLIDAKSWYIIRRTPAAAMPTIELSEAERRKIERNE
jgi:hypothetical protein